MNPPGLIRLPVGRQAGRSLIWMNLKNIKERALKAINGATTPEALIEARVVFLGRKSELVNLLRSLKDLPADKRRSAGAALNGLRVELERLIAKKIKGVGKGGGTKQFDFTLPGVRPNTGHLHPLSRVERELADIFRSMNFSVVEGPEVETEYYNFDALNIPANHPAREMWDTFWLRSNQKEQLTIDNKQLTKGHMSNVKSQKLLLRTHTSPMQIRYMETHQPPFQIIVPGRVFRYEATDVSHEVNFYQVEGLMVGRDISMANFKYVIEAFFKKFFPSKGGKEGVEFRYRPSYFPFVEPGIEVDIRLGHGKWLEVMGAGMVHPKVFEYAHYNPRDLQGFAFGMGLDRLAMIKYKVPDIRLFYSGDLRFIKQF